MSAGSFSRREVPAHDQESGQRIDRRSRRLTFSLPSPFLFAVVLVFVILPLIWPSIDDQAAQSSAQVTFDVKTDLTSLAVTADGHCVVATCRDRPVWIWRQNSKRAWNETRFPEHWPGGSRSLALTPDGKTLATGNADGTVSLWDLESGHNLANLASGPEMVLGVAFSPDGSTLASASASSQIHLWDVASRHLRTVLEGHLGPVTAIGFTPDGQTLLSGGEDGTVRLWNLQDPRDQTVLRGHHDVVLALAASPDGTYVASSSLGGHGIDVWNRRTKQIRVVLHSEVPTLTCLAFDRDQRTLAAGDEHGSVSLWDIVEGKQRATFPAHVGWIKGLAFSSAAHTLATGGNDGLVRVWDLAKLAGSS
jgi:WD40 repeat protein